MTIIGAMITSHIIVQRLTDFVWLGNARVVDSGHVLRVARLFMGLRRGLKRLKEYYQKLSPVTDASIFYPLATSCLDERTGNLLTFRYQETPKISNPSCTVFSAVDCSNEKRKLTIKFVERYSKEAHRILEDQGLAPPLVYSGDVWQDERLGRGCRPRQMVVMEHVPGETLFVRSATYAAREEVRRAVQILHDAGYVHGDIRKPNVLIVDGDTGANGKKEAPRIMILDFDWAGKEGEVRYPFGLSSSITWADGVKDYELITKKHDMEMVDQLY